MQAIIMAAGKGSRLGNLTQNKPKAFLEIQGIKLIEYNIALLHANGIHNIILVTGYHNEMYEELAQSVGGVTCVYNPFYEMMNVLGSFYMAQEYLREEDLVYMHADTLCEPALFSEMIHKQGDMILPIEFKACDEEAMKVCTKQGSVVEISKQIPCDRGEGEFIGIAKICNTMIQPLKQAVKELMAEKSFTSYFEDAIQRLIDKQMYKIIPLDLKNRFWGEIDFLEDYERATAEISPELVAIAKEKYERKELYQV